MPAWLTQISQFVVFLAISALGFTFLILSLIFGELFEHLDVSVDHDVSGEGPGILSTRVLSVFVTAFGGFGAVATHYGLGTLGASGVGFLSGLFFAALIYAFATFLYRQQASSGVRTAELIGRHARVVVSIPAGGVGQVRCQIGEELVDKIARARDGSAIPDGTAVTIVEVLGDSAIVTRQVSRT
jgi:membrane protein implicated in regulation of membrane protease activity